MFGQISNYENRFFVSGQEVLGIESLDVAYSNSLSTAKLLGFANGHTIVTGPTKQDVSISRNLIYQDPILNYTGAVNMSGSINYNDDSYGFNSGYLETYSVNCAVGSIPKVSASISVYDEMVRFDKNNEGSVATPNIFIPNQGSITLTCDNSSTNRVVGFDYSVKISRKPIYSIGSLFPSEVITFPILEYTASVQIDVDDAFLQNAHSFLSQLQEKTVSFTIRSRDNATILQQLSLPKASLVSETLSSSADGGVKLTLNYIGHS